MKNWTGLEHVSALSSPTEENVTESVVESKFKVNTEDVVTADGVRAESRQKMVGKTVLEETGKEVSIQKIESISDDGEINLTIDKGRDVLSLFSSFACVDKHAIFIDRGSLLPSCTLHHNHVTVETVKVC